MQRRLQQSTSRWSTTAPRREPESLKAATVRKSRLASQCAFWTILGAQAICVMLFLNAWAESGSVNAEASVKRHGRPASQWELLPGVGPWLLLLTVAWNGLYLYTWRSSPGYVDASRAPKMPAPSITEDGTFAAPTAAATAAHASSVCPADSVGSAPGPTIPTPRTSGSDRQTPPDDSTGPSPGVHQAAGQQDPQTATAAVTMPVNRGHRFRTSGAETHHQAQGAAAAPQYQQHASSPARPREQRRQNSAPASTLGNDTHPGGDQASAAKVAADDRSLSSHRTQPELDYSSGDTFIVHSSRESPAPLLGRSDGWSTPQDANRLGRIEDSPGKFATHWRGFSTESFPRIAHGLYNTAVSGESDVTASAPGSLQTTSPQMAAVLPAAAVPHPHAGVLPQALLPHLATSGTAARRPLPHGAPPHAPGSTCAAAHQTAPVTVGQQKAVGHGVARMAREQAEQDQQDSVGVKKTTGGGGDMHGFTDPATALRYCGVCFQWQPMRSKHCALCGKCVLRYDHHCFWVGTCVGQHNQGRFVLMLIVLVPWMVSALHAASLNTSLLSKSWASLVVSMILAIFAALMCGFGGALLAFHAYLVATGQTTFEVCKTPSPSYLRLHASRLKRGAQTAASTPSSSSMRSATPGALTPETAISIPATYDVEDGADGGNGGSLLHRRGEDNGLSKDDAAFASVASSASGVRPAALSWWVRARLIARHPRLFFTNRISGAVSLFRRRLGSHDHSEGGRLLSQGPPGEGPCGAMTSGPFDRGVVKNTADFFFGDSEMVWRLPQSPAGCV